MGKWSFIDGEVKWNSRESEAKKPYSGKWDYIVREKRWTDHKLIDWREYVRDRLIKYLKQYFIVLSIISLHTHD